MFCTKGKRGWIWAGIVAGLIVFASGRSQVAAPNIVDIDKFGHFLVFGLLATLVARNGFVPGCSWLPILMVSLFGITDEWHQSFTPGRSVEVADWMADTAGAALAVTLYAYWGWYRRLLEMPLIRPAPSIKAENPIVSEPNADYPPGRQRVNHPGQDAH